MRRLTAFLLVMGLFVCSSKAQYDPTIFAEWQMMQYNTMYQQNAQMIQQQSQIWNQSTNFPSSVFTTAPITNFVFVPSTPVFSPVTTDNVSTTDNYNNVNSKTQQSTSRPICRTCHGGGKCNSCGGSGNRTDNYLGTGVNKSKRCGVCGGNGNCSVCNGTGYR